jgi:superfamily II DNA or RNA helicase
MHIPDYIDNKRHKLQTVLKQLIEDENQLDLDIATGFFRIEAWLRLEETMNHLKSLRLLIGRDPTIRPAEGNRIDLIKYFSNDIRQQLNREQLKLQYKQQIDRMIAYLEHDHIQVRLYGATTGEFLHAKAYIFDRYSIVGSSNFTPSGISKNRELNVINKIEAVARDLKENWFEEFWNDPSVDQDYKAKLIDALNASKFGSKAYTPYQVFLKALYELFKDDSIVTEGDHTALELASFQQEGFERAIRLIEKHQGCMVADAVGLGKTYIGLRVIDYYLIKLRRLRYVPKALVICPAQLRDLVWEKKLEEFGLKADVVSQEEMGRREFDRSKYRNYDIIVIDESHHFRNSATKRYNSLKKLLSGGNLSKRVLLLTATPINNTIFDLYHQILLITRGNDKYYQEWGIKNLRTYFEHLAKGNLEITELLMQTMVRRSRQDVIKRQKAGEEIRIAGRLINFPKRQLEKFTYNFEESFSGLYLGLADKIDQLNLAPYNIKAFKNRQQKADETEVKRNKALVALQKALYLKRFESSLIAFKNSITNQAKFQTQFYKLLTEENKLLDSKNFRKLLLETQLEDDGEDSLGGIIEALEEVEPEDYDIAQLTEQIKNDLSTLNTIIQNIKKIEQFGDSVGESDCKLVAFKNLLLELKGQKILVFSYFKDTAKYIYNKISQDTAWCAAMGNPKLDIITGDTSGKQREQKVKYFAPKANTESQEERDVIATHPIDILICTDVLSEGQNLQDAGILVNYDLHWNPVRMIQRAGRIDRLGTDYEKLYIYNCFPEEGLEKLLGLVQRLQERIASIDRNVGLDASVLGEEISQKSLEELIKLKQADSEAEKQAILYELEQASDLISLDEMRLPLLEFIQQVGHEQVEEIPLGIHSTRKFKIPDPNFTEGGIFLAFKAGDRNFWHFYPRQNGFITTEPNLLVTDKRKIFNWLKCQQSDFPSPESLPPIKFDDSVFMVIEDATRNLLESLKRENTGNRIKPRLTRVLNSIKEILVQPTLWEPFKSEDLTILKDRIYKIITTNSDLRNYNQELKSIWTQYKRNSEIETLLNKLDELFAENELYQDDTLTPESIRKVIQAEDLELVCYEWFYPE